MSKVSEEKISQLQVLQQNLQNISMQKQQLQLQINQIELSLSEAESSDKTYRIIGDVMIATEKDSLIKYLKERNESLSLMLKNYEGQEKRLREKGNELQKEIVEGMKKKE